MYDINPDKKKQGIEKQGERVKEWYTKFNLNISVDQTGKRENKL